MPSTAVLRKVAKNLFFILAVIVIAHAAIRGPRRELYADVNSTPNSTPSSIPNSTPNSTPSNGPNSTNSKEESPPPATDALTEYAVDLNEDGRNIVMSQSWRYVGPRGQMGPTGPAGPPGPQGLIGPTGISGQLGPQGATGPVGPTGPAGQPGTMGPTGPMGPKGDTGPQGAQGPPGQTTTIEGKASTIPGPPGAQGPVGPKGDRGPQGEQGVRGPGGADGARGPTGPKGDQGPQGPQGRQGAQGPSGSNGSNGSQGPRGEQGPAGSGLGSGLASHEGEFRILNGSGQGCFGSSSCGWWTHFNYENAGRNYIRGSYLRVDCPFYNYSDGRSKKDIRQLSDTEVDRLSGAHGAAYRRKTADANTPVEYGFIAQDVERVYPNLVSTSKTDGSKSVNYLGFVPLLTEKVNRIQPRPGMLCLDAQTCLTSEMVRKLLTLIA